MKNVLSLFIINFLIISVCDNYRLIYHEDISHFYIIFVSVMCFLASIAFYQDK